MTNKFGTLLRASRLGYREIYDGIWVKVDANGPPWRVSIATDPQSMAVQSARGSKNHICWWEGDPNGIKMRQASTELAELLENVLVLPCPIVAIVDDSGKILKKDIQDPKE